MLVNSINNQQNFCAVKFNPKVEAWNPRILEAVLDSTAVKKAIIKNETSGYDTLIHHSKRDKDKSMFQIDEFIVSKLGENINNLEFNIETYKNEEAIKSIIDFIKTKDAELNISSKLKNFNEFVKNIKNKGEKTC